MRVSVSRTINAAHVLPGTQLHGHTYRLTATVDAEKNAVTGFAFTFDELRKALRAATDHYDHDRLDRTLSEMPATAENLATCIARAMTKALGRIVDIRVEVGDDGVVETEMYRREDGEYFSR